MPKSKNGRLRNLKAGMNKFPKRGEIYWISLDPTVGTEVNKTRPGLILSNNLANENSGRVIIGPITSSVRIIYPFETQIKMPSSLSKVMLDQIRSVDKSRLGKKICTITFEEMQEVERALKISLALP